MRVAILVCAAMLSALDVRSVTAHATRETVKHRPNLLLILTDDQRADTLWAMPLLKSWLQDHGVTFTENLVNSPLCCPNRSSLLTGQYVRRHHVYSNGSPSGGAGKIDDSQTIGVWLQQNGYRTGYFGKWLNAFLESTFPDWPHIVPGWDDQRLNIGSTGAVYTNYTMLENGVSVFYGTGPVNYKTNRVGQMVRDFISATPQHQPFFAVYAPVAPHEPYIPQGTDRLFFESLANYRPPSYNETDVSDKPAWVQALPLLTATKSKTMDTHRRRYLETLLAVDRQIDEIMTLLQTTGRLDDTIVIFTSDNGYTFGEHRLEDGKSCVYEECLKVPLVIRTPDTVEQPRIDTRLTQTVDLTATLLDYADATSPLQLDGLSLRPLLEQTATTWRQDLLIEYYATNIRKPFEAVRTEQDIYAQILDTYLKPKAGQHEYYDLTLDPYELDNRVNDPSVAERVQELIARLAALKAQ